MKVGRVNFVGAALLCWILKTYHDFKRNEDKTSLDEPIKHFNFIISSDL